MAILINKIPSTCSMVEVGNVPYELSSLPSPRKVKEFVQLVRRMVDRDETMWGRRVAIVNTNHWFCTWFTSGIRKVASYRGNCGDVYIYLIDLVH